MIVLVAELKARAGQERKVEGILKGMIPNVQNEKGTRKYILHQAKADPSRFMFYEEYVDQAALDTHGATSYFKQLGKDLEGLLDGSPKETFYVPIDSIKR